MVDVTVCEMKCVPEKNLLHTLLLSDSTVLIL